MQKTESVKPKAESVKLKAESVKQKAIRADINTRVNSFLLLAFSVTLLAFSVKTAAQDSTALYIQQVLHPQEAEMRTQALARLAALQPPAAFPFLAAVSSSSLYLLDGRAVTTGSRSAGQDDRFPIYEVYPGQRQLKDEKGRPLLLPLSALQPVTASRPQRLQLAPLAAVLDMFSADAQKRAMAYSQQGAKGAAHADALRLALQTETDPLALRAGREAMYAVRLQRATDAAAARLLIDSLYQHNGDNATGILRNWAKKPGVPQEAAAYALQQAQRLDSHYAWMQRIQNLFSGVSLGSILILVSLGLAIVYGLAGIINMAHGEFLMIGAYTTYCMELLFTNVLQVQDANWFFIAALPASFVTAGLAGLLLERLVIRHLYARPLESLLATWGISLILIQAARTLFGDLTAVKLPGMLAGGWQVTPHLVLPWNRLFIILLTIVVVIALYGLLFRSRLGMQIRAVTQNRNMAACLGINTKRVDAVTFFIGSGLAGLAGCAMTLIGNVVPDMGQTYIVDSFLVVVTGGVGKLMGTIAAGLGIGIFSKVLEAFFQAVYGKVLILLGIMIFMQFRPRGLFPDKGRIAEN
ncbi:urea ABC transporter permease subunit UrtB [Chitinophaga japonensis]|uniref:Amino acid/amide ABC transporter membrane protein 1, HAAT family (TC 3.A.1.4.-) n=1 Tax=Chitinophaga japonensis TaxID=104662 RepID=A0A562T7V4_CHIJA|nr:urea ABC transporter permease subunit UrtB [Chitinophaga japonensis]TWI89066.1 amino acid/amide ABC transporter membrane protein 1, HAAT family (TC 3.A.1.4.-) [Chitinophaga japonensis]